MFFLKLKLIRSYQIRLQKQSSIFVNEPNIKHIQFFINDLDRMQSSQHNLPISDLVKVNKFTLFLGKYPLEEQKQYALSELQRIIQIIYQESNQTSIKLQDELFLYQHVRQFHGNYWTITDNKAFLPIYSCIPQIAFLNVHAMNISSCNITNIEPLSFLNAPNMWTLEMYGNHIHSIKPFVKNKELANMGYLTLYQNSITDLALVYRSKVDSLNYLVLDINTQNNVFCQDLSFIFKLPFKAKGQLVRIWYTPQKRVMKPIQNLSTKFGDIYQKY